MLFSDVFFLLSSTHTKLYLQDTRDIRGAHHNGLLIPNT
jgi:hypothetical protein